MSFSGHLIFHTHDPYGMLRVLEDGDQRLLSFGPGDEQSACLKSEPSHLLFDYTRAMFLAVLFKRPKKVLCLGLGAGSIITALHKHFKGIKVTAVELRQTVIDLAHNYFYLPQSKRINIHCGDAEEYIKKNPERYDLIFSDLYTSEGLAPLQMQKGFIENCALQLKEGGWLVINCWNEHQHEEQLMAYLESFFHEIRLIVTADGNWVIYASKVPLEYTAKDLKKEACNWSSKLGFSLVKVLNRSEIHTW